MDVHPKRIKKIAKAPAKKSQPRITTVAHQPSVKKKILSARKSNDSLCWDLPEN
jgi:hypothetical protein